LAFILKNIFHNLLVSICLAIQGDETSEMFIIDTGRVQLTRVIHAASSAKKHFADAVKKLASMRPLLSPSSHSTSDSPAASTPPKRRSSLDLVESALESVKQGLKTHARKLSRSFSNVSAEEGPEDEISKKSSGSGSRALKVPNNTPQGSFDSGSTPIITPGDTPQGKTPDKSPRDETPDSMPRGSGGYRRSDGITTPVKMPRDRSIKPNDSEMKTPGGGCTPSDGKGAPATTAHGTGNNAAHGVGTSGTKKDGCSPPLVLGLGPGDFFGEAAVLGQKQSTSALSTEFSCFQVIYGPSLFPVFSSVRDFLPSSLHYVCFVSFLRSDYA
jgi:CRP-like cAMP-binding protein